MKKIIVIMLVAVSALMAESESQWANILRLPSWLKGGKCEYVNRASFKMIKYVPGPNDVLLACPLGDDFAYYEVAFDYNLSYIVIALNPIPRLGGAHRAVTMLDDVVFAEDYDNYGVRERVKKDWSSPEDIREAYRILKHNFTLPTKTKKRR